MKTVTKIDRIADTATKKKKLRVAAYCRVSTDSDAQLESLEAQKAHYENYILSRDDWEFAGLYYDEGITGTKKGIKNKPSKEIYPQRPAFIQEMSEPLSRSFSRQCRPIPTHLSGKAPSAALPLRLS